MASPESILFGKLVIPAVYLLSSRSVLPILNDLRRNERLPAERLAELQLRKLQQLVAHAYHNTPFYRKRFAEIGAQPQDIKTLEDYARLPLLTRQDLRSHRQEMVAKNYPKSALFLSSTGGSSGQPVIYYQDTRYANSVAAASMWREWSWAGIRPGDRHLYLWAGPREITSSRSRRKRAGFFLLRRMFVAAYDMGPAQLDRIIGQVQTFHPRFIYGYESSVTALARYLLDRQMRLPGVAAAMTTAECLLPEHRAQITEAFGCQVFDQYGSREGRSIASQCAHGSMHIESDLNVVEFIPDPGLPPDAPQRIVVTPLESYGCPLLRYANDDLGLPGAPCDCWLPYPTMRLEGGRLTDNFLLPSGRLVYGGYFTRLGRCTPGIKQFQFRQLAPDHVLFKVVWENPKVAEKGRPHLKRVIAGAEAHLGEDCKIEMQEVDRIPVTGSGKYRYTYSDAASFMFDSWIGVAPDRRIGAGACPVEEQINH